MTENQSDYQPGHITQIQQIYWTNKPYAALNKSQDYTVVNLDISRHFEKIWHIGLLGKRNT